MKQPRLEKWHVGPDDSLYGYVYNHPKGLRDGEYVRTSRVVEFDKATGKARTENTNYELGEPASVVGEPRDPAVEL